MASLPAVVHIGPMKTGTTAFAVACTQAERGGTMPEARRRAVEGRAVIVLAATEPSYQVNPRALTDAILDAVDLPRLPISEAIPTRRTHPRFSVDGFRERASDSSAPSESAGRT